MKLVLIMLFSLPLTIFCQVKDPYVSAREQMVSSQIAARLKKT